MRHSLRNVAALGLLGWGTVTLALHGCSNRLGPVRASQNVGGIGRPTLPDVAIEQAKVCMADYGSQLPPGLVELTSTVEVDGDRYKLDVSLDGVAQTAPDFAACMRNVLRDMPIAEGPLHEGVATLQYRRQHANDGPVALRRFVETIPGVPIVESELVLQADGHTVLLPITIRVVDEQVKQIDLDKALLAKIGQLALESVGYDEIMRQAKEQGWIKTVRKVQPKAPAGKQLIAQSETEVVVLMFEVFTEHAVTAGIVSQLDSPLPGPADLAAIGIMAMALYKVGAIGINALTAATAPAPASSPPPPPPLPPSPPRRWPNQTCENAELDRLEKEKKKICEPEEGFATICPKNPLKKNEFAKIPCSLIKLSLQQRQACVAARWEVQNKCFGGKPDDRHKGQIDEVQNGVNNCEAFKLINCAHGHPMANL